MALPARRLLLTLQRRAYTLPRSSGVNITHRTFASTRIFKSEQPSKVTNSEPESIPDEVLDAMPSHVHEEMKHFGEIYKTQLEQLEASPGAMNALKTLQEAVKAKDIDLGNATSLSPSVMLRLAADPQIREAGRNAMVELERAGIDPVKMEELMWALQANDLDLEEGNENENSKQA